jgi:hypothetical protein
LAAPIEQYETIKKTNVVNNIEPTGDGAIRAGGILQPNKIVLKAIKGGLKRGQFLLERVNRAKRPPFLSAKRFIHNQAIIDRLAEYDESLSLYYAGFKRTVLTVRPLFSSIPLLFSPFTQLYLFSSDKHRRRSHHARSNRRTRSSAHRACHRP